MGLNSSCTPGLQVNLCIVDVASGGFQCMTSEKVKSFIPFEKGGSLNCASPDDTEDYLKACKQHKVLAVTLCHLYDAEFLCIEPDHTQFTQSYSDTDNYVCMTDHDRKRVEERCLAAGLML